MHSVSKNTGLNMNTILKLALTAACVVAIAWPLLSLSKAATKHQDSYSYRTDVVKPAPFVLTPQSEAIW